VSYIRTDASRSIGWTAINARTDHFSDARPVAYAGNHEALRDVIGPTLHPIEIDQWSRRCRPWSTDSGGAPRPMGHGFGRAWPSLPV